MTFNTSIWPKDRGLAGTYTMSQSEPENNRNKGMLHTPQIFRTGTSSVDAV